MKYHNMEPVGLSTENSPSACNLGQIGHVHYNPLNHVLVSLVISCPRFPNIHFHYTFTNFLTNIGVGSNSYEKLKHLNIQAHFLLIKFHQWGNRIWTVNSCYYSVQTLLSSRLLSNNLKIKIYKAIILPVVLYGCKTCSLTLSEECRLRVFQNRILRQIFGPKRDADGEWKRLILRNFKVCPVHLILSGWLSLED